MFTQWDHESFSHYNNSNRNGIINNTKKLNRCLENYTAESLQFYSSIGEDLF